MPFFTSKKARVKQLPTVTPGQAAGVETLAGQAQRFPEFFESLGFDPTRTQEAFQRGVAQPAIREFQEQIAPGIQERFIGAGAGRGSAAMRALGTAGERLEEGLSAQLAQQLQAGEQFGQKAQLEALMRALGLGLGTQTFQNVQIPGQQSTLGALAPYAMQALGTAAGGFLGGPGGSALAQKLFGGGQTAQQPQAAAQQPFQSQFGLPEFDPRLRR